MTKIDSQTPLARRILERIEQLQTSAYAVSLKASGGQSKDIIKNIFNGRTVNPRTDTLQKIADALGVTTSWLLHGDGEPPPPIIEPAGGNVRMANRATPMQSRQAKNLPVLGTAAGSLGGAFQFDGGVIEYVTRPSGVSHVPDAYGFYVEGESMDPAHPHGSLRIAHPRKPPQIGDTVVIVAKYKENGPQEAFIKRLVKRTADKLVVEQFNPPARIEFDKRFVASCHKVLELEELLGF